MTSLARQSWTHIVVAFLLMGGWAIFANRTHPMPQPIIAGVIQGALSGAITFVLKRMVEAVARRFFGAAAIILPPLIAVGLSLAILTTIHTLAGTPEIATTIALPTSVTAIYSTLYAYALWRNRKASNG